MPIRLTRRTAALLLAMTTISRDGLTAAAEGSPVKSGPFTVRIEGTDTAPVRGATGTLESISATAIRLTGTEPEELPLGDVRRLEVVASALPATPPVVVLQLVGGGHLSGMGFTVTESTAKESTATISRDAAGAGRLPLDLVALAFWPRSGEDPTTPAWLAAVPERPESDLVIVRQGDAFECVECAIMAVGDDTVTVLLDGERIPVARDRVAGLRWLRPATAPASGTLVNVSGGRLVVADVRWSPAEFVLDLPVREVPARDVAPAKGRITLPASWLETIDYAAGRTVRLADLTAEATVVEPFVPGLATVEELRGFFAPRFVAVAGADADRSGAHTLLVRPRTVVTWRVPADSRRFQATIRPDGEAAHSSVMITVDGREVVRYEPSTAAATEPKPVSLDVAGARRLTLTVDATAGIGSPVRLEQPIFEK
jgi:hypothetical protein